MIHWTPEERERQARATKAMIEMVQGPDRFSRIEARFEEIIRRAYNYGYSPLVLELDHIWKEAERIESFLESKRAEVRDGK